MLFALNIFFFVFHTAWMIFNLIGWAWRRTRPFQLLTIGLTAFSWFILGIWNGLGFCICTQWHWEVRQRLGYRDQERSYVALLIHSMTGIHVNEMLSEAVTGILFVIVTILGVTISLHDRRRRVGERRN